MSDGLVPEVERAINDGDPDRVVELLAPLKEKERRAAAKHFKDPFARAGWNWQTRDEPRYVAADLAWIGTATARQLATRAWLLQREWGRVDERCYLLVAARGRRFVTDFVRMLLQGDGPGLWPLVHRAVREGVIDRPEGDGYVRAMIGGVGLRPGLNPHENLDQVYEGLLEDPELLDQVWLVFEHEVGDLLGYQATWSSSQPGKYERGENRWAYALKRLAAEGKLDRQRLLDASLDALMRDFRPSTLAWYAQFHEELEPTPEEREARLDRYLALITTPAPTSLKAGLAAVKELGEVVPAEDLARVAATPLLQPQKTHAIAMLRQLEAAAKRDEAGRPVLLAAAAEALSHEKVDVQERALKLLERYEDDAPRAELLSYLDAIAPTLRPRLEQLTGFETEREISAPALEELTGAAAVAVQNGRWPDPRVPEPAPNGESLVPVESVDELIELAAALLEGQGTGDDAERFLDGVSRLCDERPARFKQRTEGLVKQAQPPWVMFPGATSGHHLVSQLVISWARGARPVAVAKPSIGGVLVDRVVEVARRARRGVNRPLLSFPTHAGGWLSEERLAEREDGAGRFRNRPDPADRATARYRTLNGGGFGLMPEIRIAEKRWAFGEPQHRVGFQILSTPPELADDQQIGVSLRTLGQDEVAWYEQDARWPVADELGARWLLTMLPAYPEVQFARALTAIVDFVDVNPYGHPEVVLEWMVDPRTPLRDPAWTAVAAALVAKSPDLQRAATDVVVATISDGRFDPERLGHGIAWLLGNGFGTLTRIESSLRDAARVSPLHAAQIVRALEAFMVACPAEQKHLHVPLGLALDLAAGAGTAFESEAARASVERIGGSASKSSKVGKAAHGLLGLVRDEPSHGAILRLAASAAA